MNALVVFALATTLAAMPPSPSPRPSSHRAAAEGADHDYETLWASLTFEVPEATR